MKSSAMRDLMAITERPEVISLAGGLPDTSTFPAESLAALTAKMAATGAARALQYGPTEGMAATKACIAEVMAAEGTLSTPRTCSSPPAASRSSTSCARRSSTRETSSSAEAPTYPGAVPTFMSYQADVVQIAMDDDGMRVDELEATLDRLDAEGRRPKFIYTIPNFQNLAGVTLSLPRRRRLVEVARERELLVLEDNPYGLLRYEGDPLPTLYSARPRRVRRLPRHVLEDPVARDPRRLDDRAGAGAREDEPRQTGRRSCSPAFSQMFVTTYFEHDRWQDYLRSLVDLYRRRRDTMSTRWPSTSPRGLRDAPAGRLFIWATMPDYIDTTDLLAGAVAQRRVQPRPRRLPRRARRGIPMRLNFSGVADEDTCEGIRRIGEVAASSLACMGR